MTDEKVDSESGTGSGRRASHERKDGAKEESGRRKGDPLDRIDWELQHEQKQEEEQL